MGDYVNENQIARMEEARNSFIRGDIGANELQQQLVQIMMEPEENTSGSSDVPTVDDNPPPSSLHVWNGDTWVLPAQHEIYMLLDLEHTEEDKKNVEDRLADQLAEVDSFEDPMPEEQEVV